MSRSYLIPLALLAFLTSCDARKQPTKTYDLGSRVEVGHLIYTVYETQWLHQIGAGDAARVPKGQFFLVRISAVNSGSEEMYVPNVILEGDDGKTVEEAQDGTDVPQWMGYVRKVKPADSISGNLVFDAEPKHYRMRLTDEDGEKVAYVDLPLTFNAETPQISAPDASAPPPAKK